MRMKTNAVVSVVAMVLLAFAASVRLVAQGHRQPPPHYTITDLGTLGGTFSIAAGITSDGTVAGFSTLPGDQIYHPFLWRDGVMTDLGTLGILTLTGLNQPVNNQNQVTGIFNTGIPDPNGEDFCGFAAGAGGTNDVCLPFVWQKGFLSPLPTIGGNNGAAGQVNSRGEIAGIAETPIPDPCSPVYLQIEAVIWQRGRVRMLRPLPGDAVGNAIAINDAGDAVGVTGCVTGNLHAVLWRGGRPVDLGNLGGVTGNIALGVNNRLQVVGQSDLVGDAIHHGFLWQNGIMTDLGSLPGLPTSFANAINTRGQVVGFSEDASADEFPASPWIWEDGVMTDLNTLVSGNCPWFLHEALGINDAGQIVGHAINKVTGEIHAYLATPIEADNEAQDAVFDHVDEPKIQVPENIRALLGRQSNFRDRWVSQGTHKE